MWGFALLGIGLVLALKSATGTVLGYVNGVPRVIQVAEVAPGKVMRADAAAAFLAMQAAARAAGFNLTVTSAWRSQAEQVALYAKYLAGVGNLAAKPGFSNHQGGTSVDIGGVNSFTSAAYAWLKTNAGRYGFVNDVSTEYWHWTYKGG